MRMSDIIDFETARLGLNADQPPFKVKRSGHCSHPTKVVDSDRRTVTCDQCKAQLDPLDALARLAREWSNYAYRLAELKKDANKAAVELDDIKRKIRNAKARLRRAEK